MRHHHLGDPAGADDCDPAAAQPRELAKRPADHAEVRQRDRLHPGVLPAEIERGAGRVGGAACRGRQRRSLASRSGDIAHDRHDEAALGIDCDTNIDALDQTPGRPAPELYQGVERGLRPAGSRNKRASSGHFGSLPVRHSSISASSVTVAGTTSACAAAIRWAHGAPHHPAQCLGRNLPRRDSWRLAPRRPVWIGAAGSGGLYSVENRHRVCVRGAANRRKHLKHSRWCRFRRGLSATAACFSPVSRLADHGCQYPARRPRQNSTRGRTKLSPDHLWSPKPPARCGHSTVTALQPRALSVSTETSG